MLPRIGLLLLLACATGASAGEVYTWKDASGRSHFSDRPLYLEAQTLAVRPPLLAAEETVDLTGTWRSQAEQGGRTLEATLTFHADQRFSGQTQLDGQPFMRYAGTWQVDGNQLLWTYTESSIPLPESLRTDSDTILAVSAEHLELLSSRSGEVRVFSRQAAAGRDG